MTNRITKKFNELYRQRRKAFIAFITAGDPSLKITEELVLSFEKAGVDIIELGVPFSDPMADGPTIQASSKRALDKGVTLAKILKTVTAIRKKSDIPIALMTYYNPIFHYGLEAFARKARLAGVDGLIVPDLPPEEGKDLIRAARAHDIATVFFISPMTSSSRMKLISKASSGFVYYVSLTGVTGARKALSDAMSGQIRRAKRSGSKPVCVGFGVSTAEQVRRIGRIADGVIVGSAIVHEIVRHKGKKDLVANVTRFVGKLSRALHVQ